MNTANKSVVGIFVAGCALVIGLAIFIFLGCSDKWCGLLGRTDYIITKSPVHSFEECARAGNPVMESFPRRCQVGNTTFIETLPQEQGRAVVVENVSAGQKLESPVTVRGKALGTWFFEASFPVRVLDAEGKVLGTGIAEAKADWMTTEYVPFEAVVTFGVATTDTGYLEFVKDNPSGLPEHDASIRIPVRFK